MPFRLKAQHGQLNYDLTVSLAGPTLLEHLQNAEVPIKSSCLGKGLCRQCRVQILKGIAPVTANDKKAFSDSQLKNGWRLSCGIRPRSAMEFQFPQIFIYQEDIKKSREPHKPWWFCCDLGTTGVELAGVDHQGIWCTLKGLNSQVSMGADVMTRLEYTQRNGVEPLTRRIRSQLTHYTKKISQQTSIEAQKKMFVAGNSAVTAFLAQQPVDQLAVSPYKPNSLESQTFSFNDFAIETLPLLYSFVGGDLFAGLFLIWQRPEILAEPWILVDVGTNSEILFWDKQKLFVSSTPAGPAFEGSSISIGMRAENGAVVNPIFTTDHWQFDILGNDLARGLCGTGLIQMISEAVDNGIVSHDGEVLKPQQLSLNSELFLSQDDIREFQLAKSAIQTGIELVQSQSITKAKKLFLAGSFGEHLPLKACRHLQLLPELECETLGNASLDGTVLWSQSSSQLKTQYQTWLAQVLTPLDLALSDQFQERFVNNMNLGAT